MRKVEQIINGTFFIKGEFIEGWYDLSSKKFHQDLEGRKKYTCIPAPVNAHTHIGDSFVNNEPRGTLEEVVGPGGLKYRMQDNESPGSILNGIRRSARYMKRNGTASFFDYREVGMSKSAQFKAMKRSHEGALIFCRPDAGSELDSISDLVDGVGISAVSDIEMDLAMDIIQNARRNDLMVSTHFSENRVEDFGMLSEFDPDFVVHCSGLKKDKEFQDLSEISEYAVICPRSNRFFGIEADYSRYEENGLNVMIGTDNVMVATPDIFQEMEFLFRIQKNRSRMEPEEILKYACETPVRFLKEQGIKTGNNWICIEGENLSPYTIITGYSGYRKIYSEMPRILS